MTSTVQFRVDIKTKQAVAKIFSSLGLDLSAGIKVYFKQVLINKGIPFPLVTENGFTRAEEAKILAEHNQTLKQYKTGKSWKVVKKEITNKN